MDRSWGARLQRGWTLTQLSLRLMQDQPGLVAVPVLTAAAAGLTLTIVALLTSAAPPVVAFVLWVVAVAVIGTVLASGQAVISCRVNGALNGQPMTNRQAVALVQPRWSTLACWGTLSFTVVVLIRSLARGRGWAGLALRILMLVMDVTWSAATFFVLPVILFEGLDTRAAITRSRALVRANWGEGVIGCSILSALFTLVGLVTFGLVLLLAVAGATTLAVVLLVLVVIGLNLLSAVASPVFTVVLYRYATGKELALGLTEADLAATFRRRTGAASSGAGR